MLSAEDLTVIRDALQRDLTPVEAACFENLWSEHCSYRSTRHLLKMMPTTGPAVLLGPGDDAAIVSFSETCALAIGMESHNHPSYVDPYDGSATGVGGIVRDVISMGAKPIALMDPLYFGPLTDEKNRYLFSHVISGISGYGNCIGVPVVRGEVVFDEGYSGNPLVNVVCVGTVDPTKYLTARVKVPGNHLVLVGARTGRDGLGGASFASRDIAEDAEAVDRPSVQIGDPFTEKLIIDAMLAMAATGKVLSCRDLGAAGLAGASSEMCSTFGGIIHAEKVHLRETGMTALEIMLAESQERMLLEVAPEDVAQIGSLAERFDLCWSDIGEVTSDPRYVVDFHGEVVCDLPIDLLIDGAPRCSTLSQERYEAVDLFTRPVTDLHTLALQVLSHPEVASREWIVSQYDHDVQLRTVSLAHDAAVLRLEDAALGLSCGCNPRHIHLRPFDGTACAVIENAANLACMGIAPLCIVNCLNFASPLDPKVYWQLSESIRGLSMMAGALQIPVVGGNVSLYNQSDEQNTQILPTPSLGMVGKGAVRRLQKPEAGWRLALVGATHPDFGGSILDTLTGCHGQAPGIPDPAVVAAVRNVMARNPDLVTTDLSQGGLLAALAGLAPDATVTLAGDLLTQLLSETYGRFLIATPDETMLAPLEYTLIGTIGGEGLTITGEGESLHLSRDELISADQTLTRTMRQSA
ncbi:phosphoribosylformylglycinamidine synthase subunit PurL [Methanosphaerula palustris]|uniref:Phosphoribosylformylglycinamidine synthase subunit PurL n=1 Tax=Methanosphaerula palustris (strain ATCC BAA-1556 / DSM 19958 / E1-9c) TaxID=521011 RepID=B8GIC4_METPE|nr:phosphoribosylformylglycinamidine synthase subunit PurL [Methanosphaerula palustris]ACL15475.1 phosphoribosylformylglycinamidine synthase II [Methanosphaerula palustris E1-9c]